MILTGGGAMLRTAAFVYMASNGSGTSCAAFDEHKESWSKMIYDLFLNKGYYKNKDNNLK